MGFWTIVAKDRNHPVWKISYAILGVVALWLTVNKFDATELKTIGTWLFMAGGLKGLQVAGKKFLGGSND